MKVTGTSNWNRVLSELDFLNRYQLVVGFFGSHDSKLLTIVRANEYGADIRPKNKYLTVPTNEVPLGSNGVAESPRNINGLFKRGNTLCKLKAGKPVVYFYLLKKSHIPARPFIRTALINNRGKYNRIIKADIDHILNGTKTAKQLLDHLGTTCVADIQKSAIKWKTPPNADLTVALKKGHANNPLIDTGKMIQNCKFMIIPI